MEQKGISVFEKTLSAAAKLPFVKVNREEYLRKELSRLCDPELVETSIISGPIGAGVPIRIVEEIARQSIKNETARVTALSAAAGLPGGFAMIGTIPADLVQFYGHIIRIAQKLAYLYGYPDMFDGENLDDGTVNVLTLFIGVMSGVQAAESALSKLAVGASSKAVTRIAAKPLTKGAIYPVVKKVAAILGQKMTKAVFARGVSKVIPLIGGAVSGGLTLATFGPMANKLKKYLSGSAYDSRNAPADGDPPADYTEYHDVDESEK